MARIGPLSASSFFGDPVHGKVLTPLLSNVTVEKRKRERRKSGRRTSQARRLSRIPTRSGDYQLRLYSDFKDEKEHCALIMGNVRGKSNVLVRIHSECFTGEVLDSSRCDCREQLTLAMQNIAEEGCGVLIYIRQEGRGIRLRDKLRACNLQD